MLDLDKGGTIEEEELRIGLEAIDVEMTNDEIQTALSEIGAGEDGVDVVGFIKFMCKTPKYKEMAAANKSVLLWRKKETKSKPKYSLFTRLKRYFFPAKK